jgi:hypothetical protein
MLLLSRFSLFFNLYSNLVNAALSMLLQENNSEKRQPCFVLRMLFNVLSGIVSPVNARAHWNYNLYAKNVQRNMAVRRNVFQISEIGAGVAIVQPRE